MFSKSIGIVGGAGPMASAFLYRMILEVCQKQYHSNDYNQFPEIILVSYPFTRGDKEKIQQEIDLCFSKLTKAGADLFCLASNSFHAFLPDISTIFFINLIDEVLFEASRLRIQKALILAAQTTIDLKLYKDLNCIYPSIEDQEKVNQIIREVAQGIVQERQAEVLRKIIEKLHKITPFDGVILACTELPLIHKSFSLSIGESYQFLPVIDSVQVLAKKLIASAL